MVTFSLSGIMVFLILLIMTIFILFGIQVLFTFIISLLAAVIFLHLFRVVSYNVFVKMRANTDKIIQIKQLKDFLETGNYDDKELFKNYKSYSIFFPSMPLIHIYQIRDRSLETKEKLLLLTN